MTDNVVPLEQRAAEQLPHDSELEGALLGALMAGGADVDTVLEIVRPDDFYDPAHGRILEAIITLVDRDKAPRPLALQQHLAGDEAIPSDYLLGLVAGVISLKQAPDYARQIADMARRREIIRICEETARAARHVSLDTSAQSVLDEHEASLQRLEGPADESTEKPLGMAADEALATVAAAKDHSGEISGIPTGFSALDHKLAGLQAPDVLIVAGRPSMGKSALAGNIAYNVAAGGRHVMLFSLEMSSTQIAHRIVSAQSRVRSEDMRKGYISDADMDALHASRDAIYDLPLTIDDDGRMTVSKIRTRARRQARRRGLDLIIIDYIQKLSASDQMRRRHSNVADMTEISGDIKTLAKELGVPILALSQLSREVERREDKRPMLSDLRESGALEQDADVVMFVYRDEYYAKKDEPLRGQHKTDALFEEAWNKWQERINACVGKADIIVAKQRMGPTGEIKLQFDGDTMSFRDPDQTTQEDLL